MAAKRKPARRSAERGSALYGVLIGLLIGLVVAAVVAFYVTRAPIPFVDRASRGPAEKPLPNGRNMPDPNLGLYGRDGAAGTVPSGPTATAPAPVPEAGTSEPRPAPPTDDLGALIATLPSFGAGDPPSARAPANEAAPRKPAPRAEPSTPTPAAAAAETAKQSAGKYMLQAGAYRRPEEAEALKARILLLGLPVTVQRAEVNGKPVNRVRVGPFSRLDDMNRARTRLGENDIEAAVVRQ